MMGDRDLKSFSLAVAALEPYFKDLVFRRRLGALPLHPSSRRPGSDIFSSGSKTR